MYETPPPILLCVTRRRCLARRVLLHRVVQVADASALVDAHHRPPLVVGGHSTQPKVLDERVVAAVVVIHEE